MTLKLSPNIYPQNVRYCPKYRPRNPIATDILALGNPENGFFAKMAPETTSGSGCYFIFRFSVTDFVDNATNVENDPYTFSRTLTSKLKTSKNI